MALGARVSDVEAEHRPFILEVEHRDEYVCAASGEKCSGRAVVVRGRGWWKEQIREVPELVFSPETLRAAIEG